MKTIQAIRILKSSRRKIPLLALHVGPPSLRLCIMSDEQGDAEVIARAFHERYERLAPAHSYRTREASAVPWENVPENNKSLMVAVVRSLLDDGVIASIS